MQMETSDSRASRIGVRPLQAPEGKLQRGWPTTTRTTAPYEDEQDRQCNSRPGSLQETELQETELQETERRKGQRRLPKSGNIPWKIIGMGIIALALATVTVAVTVL